MKKTEKEYLEERISNLRNMKLMFDFDFAKEKQAYDTKIQMVRESIDECDRRLEEIAKYNQREDV